MELVLDVGGRTTWDMYALAKIGAIPMVGHDLDWMIGCEGDFWYLGNVVIELQKGGRVILAGTTTRLFQSFVPPQLDSRTEVEEADGEDVSV